MAMPPRKNRKEDSWPPESQTQLPPSLKHIPFPSSSSSTADNFSCDPWTKPIVFPRGYKFVPTDEDLILYYLKPFLRSNKNPPSNVPIHRVNIYESNPERLSKEYEKGNDKEWFFITERTKLHEGGKNQNRSDNGGFWKARGALQKIKAGKDVVGYKNVLYYYIGKNPNGVKTDWMMYEYLIESSSSSTQDKSNGDSKRGDHALCKIYLTPRGIKRKAEEEENEKRMKKKKEEGVEAEEVEELFPLYELINCHQIPDDIDCFFTGFNDPYQLDIDTESCNSCCLKKSSDKD